MPIVGILHGRKDGSKGLTPELAVRAVVSSVVAKQRIIVLYRTALDGRLPVEREMVSRGKESHAGWVVIRTINAYGSLTAHHAVISNVLIGVGQNATGESQLGDCGKSNRKNHFKLHYPKSCFELRLQRY